MDKSTREKNDVLSMITKNRIPRQVWDYYKKTRDVDVRNAIVEANFGLCSFALKNFQGHLHYQDAFQTGLLALIKAVERYDPEIGTFSSYAVKCIWGCAVREKGLLDGCPPSKRQLYLSVYNYWICNPWDSVKEVASHFAKEGESEADVARVLSITNTLPLQSSPNQDEDICYEDILGELDDGFLEIERESIKKDLYSVVSEIAKFDKFESKKNAIEHLYGLGDCEKGMTASQYARERGVSCACISEIDRNFLKQMRKPENKKKIRKALGVPDFVKDCDVADYLFC